MMKTTISSEEKRQERNDRQHASPIVVIEVTPPNDLSVNNPYVVPLDGSCVDSLGGFYSTRINRTRKPCMSTIAPEHKSPLRPSDRLRRESAPTRLRALAGGCQRSASAPTHAVRDLIGSPRKDLPSSSSTSSPRRSLRVGSREWRVFPREV